MENQAGKLGKVVAFLDIGTNSVRLLVVRLNPNYSYTVISKEKEIVRLGEKEFMGQDTFLHPEAMQRAILVCKRFAELSRTYGASDVSAVATSAVREASNKAEFIDRLEKETGLKVKVISGKEEARLVYLGISSGVSIGDRRALFIDLGGGSTEMVIATQSNIDYIESFKLGAIRLTAMFLREGRKDPIPRGTYQAMKRKAEEGFLWASHMAKSLRVEMAFGTSGTFINLAEMAAKMHLNSTNGGSLAIERKALKRVVDRLVSLPLEERKKVPGITPERADIIVAGAAIVDAILDELDLKEIKVSTRGLRDGMLVDYFSKISGFPYAENIPIRERSVLQLARSCNFDEEHSAAVARLALGLFDSGKRLGLHSFDPADRELLQYAAMLHDIGDFISFNDHHLHSYYIISHSELLGFNQSEISVIANITRFHRKKFPEAKVLKEEGLDPRSQDLVVKLSTLLRIAESLDRSHCGLVKKAEFTKVNPNQVTLTVWSQRSSSLEEWRIKENTDPMGNSFGRKFVVNWIKLQ